MDGFVRCFTYTTKKGRKDVGRPQHTIKAGWAGNGRQTFGTDIEFFVFLGMANGQLLSLDNIRNFLPMNQRPTLKAFSQCIIKRTISTKPIINRPPITPKQNEAIQSNQDILSSYMVPGKLKKFFKTRPTRSQVLETENVSEHIWVKRNYRAFVKRI